MSIKGKLKLVALSLAAAVFCGVFVTSGVAYADVTACTAASELSNAGFVSNSAELEYTIANGVSSVKVASDFSIECQPSIMTNDLKIDLNGKTVTVGVRWAFDIETSGKTFTIEDSGTGGVIETNDSGVWVENGANFTINSGAIKVVSGRGRGIVIKNGGVLSINGGEIWAQNGLVGETTSYFPTILAVSDTASTTVELNAGKVTAVAAEGTALSMSGNVTLDMNGGVIVGGSDNSGVILDDGARFTLNGGGVSAKWGVAAFDNTEFVMNGGVVNGTDTGVAGNGTSDPEAGNYGGNAKFTLNAGTINSEDLGVYAPQVGGVTALGEGLVINAKNAGIEVRAGTLNVNGAIISVDSDASYSFSANGSGSTASGVAIAVSQHTTKQPISVSITDGTFTAPVALAEANPQNNSSSDLEKIRVSITGGTFNATGSNSAVESADVSGFIAGGIFSTEPAAVYLADGYGAHLYNDNKHHVISDSELGLAFAESAYTMVEGETASIPALATPEGLVRGMSYHVVHTDDSSLASSEHISASSDGTVYAEVGTTGTYKLVAEDNKGKRATTTLTVVPGINMTTKTVYAPKYEEISWEALGVTVNGEMNNVTATGGDSSSVSVNGSSKTVYLYDDNAVVSWSYNGSTVGTITFKGYDGLGNIYLRNGGVRELYDSNFNGALSYAVADPSVAGLGDWVERTSSGDSTYSVRELRGLKSGTTALSVTANDGTEVIASNGKITVFELSTTLKPAQALGTSQTFSFEVESGYIITSVYGGGSSSEEEENPAVEFVDNEDGTYTLTANRFPCYSSSYAMGDSESPESGEERCMSMTDVAVFVSSASDSSFDGIDVWFPVVLYSFAVEDQASEEVDGAEVTERSNERTLSGYTAEILETVFADDALADASSPVITLSDGSKATISDVAGLKEAVQNGEEVKMVLIAPEEMESVPENEEKDLREALAGVSSKADGTKFLNVEVLLMAGEQTYGKLTDLEKPLTVVVDVEDDGEVAEGYTREYYAFRHHNGRTDNMNARYNKDKKIVEFESDGFSTYLIAYVDTRDGADEANEDKNVPVIERDAGFTIGSYLEGTEGLDADSEEYAALTEEFKARFDSEATYERVAAALENGDTISSEVVITPLEADDVEDDVKDAIRNKLDLTFLGNISYYDAEVVVKVNGERVGTLTELAYVTVMAIPVDGAPEGYTREYVVVRYHDGVAEVIEDAEYDAEYGLLFVPSDKFSTYAIAYRDTKLAASELTPNTGANTVESAGSASANVAMAAATIMATVGLAGAAVFAKRR